GRAKESILLNSLRCNRLLRFSIQHDIDRARARAEDTNLQIITNAVRTQHAERISMSTCNEAVHLITRQAGDIESFHRLYKRGNKKQASSANASATTSLEFVIVSTSRFNCALQS